LLWAHFLNRAIALWEYLTHKTRLRAYPAEVALELTNRCNVDCIFCPHEKMKREQGFMRVELFKKVVDEIAGRAETVALDLMGESTLHPDIGELIRYCKLRHLRVALNSNMVAVTQEKMSELIDSGLDILVMSLDGSTKETYESMRRGADFERTKKNIETFLKMDPKGAYRIVQMVYTTNNRSEAGDFLRMWKNSGADCVRLRPYQNVGKGDKGLNALPVFKRKRGVCIRPWKKISVYWNGSVTMCCYDHDGHLAVGDANKESILEIWNNKRMRGYREAFVKGDLTGAPLCQECCYFVPGFFLILGSLFADSVQVRKILCILEKLLINHRIPFFRYFESRRTP